MRYCGMHLPNFSGHFSAFFLLTLIANCYTSGENVTEFSKTSGYDSNVFLGYFDFVAELFNPKTYLGLLQYPLLFNSLGEQKQAPRTASTFKNSYDFIIVGSGSAGSTTAARLSEMDCVSTLLLEAGGAAPRGNDIPFFAPIFWFSPYSWRYKTVPQKHTAAGMIERQVLIPTGKVLGGSTILNAMFYTRGCRENYDGWESMGATGWSYKEVLPYFIKAEDNKDPEYAQNGYHGTNGPLTVERYRDDNPVRTSVYEGAKELGYPVVDPNAHRLTGFADFQSTIRNQQRCSVAKAYLVPAENRENLDILSGAFVRKIVIKEGRAVGVIFDYEGKTQFVRAKKEVILSAGSINSARILILSGIGPKKHLEQLKIPVIADLPVGENFHDHPAAIMQYELKENIKILTEKALDPKNVKDYITNRKGPLTEPMSFSATAFLNGSFINPERDFPNYQMYFLEHSKYSPTKPYFNMKREVFDQVYKSYTRKPILACFVECLQPRSRGTVRLSSTDPYDPPLVDPNYMADERDIDDVVQGMKVCDKVTATKAMKKVVKAPFTTLYPGCEKFANDKDLYYKCQAKSVIVSIAHPVGTAKMGDVNDPTTVVDPQLRVKHIKGLRVIDGSIIPKIPSANTNAPIIMIAEKAADIIKKELRC